MITTSKTAPSGTPTPESPAGAGPEVAATLEAPKKKKKKYSRGPLKFVQKAEIPFTRSAHRLARAVEEGLGTWREKRSDSATKKRNGALRDALKNYGKAMTKFQKVAAKLPENFTKGLPKIRIFG
jgi:hypothetical protein